MAELNASLLLRLNDHFTRPLNKALRGVDNFGHKTSQSLSKAQRQFARFDEQMRRSAERRAKYRNRMLGAGAAGFAFAQPIRQAMKF